MTLSLVVAPLMLGLLLLGGCREAKELTELCDEFSLARYETIAADASLLLSVHGIDAEADLPVETDGARRFGVADGTVLLKVPRDALVSLLETSKLQRIVVWGAGDRVVHLDPPLRGDMLRVLDAGDGAKLNVIATFTEASSNRREELVALGVEIGSATARVVTMHAAPDAIFAILAREDLVKLSQPRVMQPGASQ